MFVGELVFKLEYLYHLSIQTLNTVGSESIHSIHSIQGFKVLCCNWMSTLSELSFIIYMRSIVHNRSYILDFSRGVHISVFVLDATAKGGIKVRGINILGSPKIISIKNM